MNFGGPINAEDIDSVHYNEFGYRIMNFFYPQLDYQKVTNDLTLVD